MGSLASNSAVKRRDFKQEYRRMATDNEMEQKQIAVDVLAAGSLDDYGLERIGGEVDC
jgi:hypothetical protein